MGLFSKEVECPNCRNIVLKRDIVWYFAAKGQPARQKDMEKICSNCAMEKFYEVILNYKDSLALVEPLNPKKYNSYQTYHFNHWIEIGAKNDKNDETKKLIEGFESTLPKKGTNCMRCSKDAIHTYYEGSVIHNDPFKWTFNPDAKYEHLCSECTVKALKKSIDEDGMIIKDAIAYPEQGKAFIFSWQI